MTNQDNTTDLRAEITEWLADRPDGPVVAVPIYNAYDDVLECIDSLLSSSPAGTPVLVLDDNSSDPRIAETLQPMSQSKGFAYVRKPSNTGFVSTVNLALESCAPRDVVIVNSDVVVPPEWLERLQAAAYHRSTIATATPLTNHGTIVSVPYRNRPVPELVEGMTTAQVDARIREASLMLRPTIPAAIGHCTYFKRSALDVVGPLDELFSPGYGEEVDYSQRTVMAGFSHVVADDLFVHHKGSRSFDPKGQEKRLLLQASHEKIIRERYPWYHPWVIEVEGDAYNPLALALESARAALLGYRIAIDATRVDGQTTGTQVLILELIRALATSPGRSAHLTMIVGDRVPQKALLGVDQLVDEVVKRSDLEDLEEPLFDLVHRPSQIRTVADLVFLRKVARRFIVSQLDCISFSNPSYTESYEEWAYLRYVTHLTFAVSDGIVFISHDAAADAAHQSLQIPPERMCVSYVGIDHQQHTAEAKAPADYVKFRDQPFILMVGTDFRHKNRVYAIKLLKELTDRYQWPGHLVLAGPKVSRGGSVVGEDRELGADPDLQARVHDLGAVSEEEKRWLLANTCLLLYPSIYEGFGIVPFEAAAAGSPALSTRLTSLDEVLGEGVTCLDSLDPAAGADLAWSFLANSEVARRQIEAIRARSSLFTWLGVAGRTWDFYRRVLHMPSRAPELATLVANGRQPAGEPVERNWRERVARALQILRTEGWSALWEEIRQFVRWLRA